jgi:UDP-glucose 4-epimerase
MPRKILITGAAGYIGSHFVEAYLASVKQGLFSKDDEIILLDDLSGGYQWAIEELKNFAKDAGQKSFEFIELNLLASQALQEVFMAKKPDLVLHFAAKINVAESVEKPDFYFENNVTGSKNLLAAMQASGCKRMVFSSTAAVYGKVETDDPILESAPTLPINPYGESKFQIEQAIQNAAKEWGLKAVIFRYFNAAGASESGKLGESHEPETHLIPLLVRAILSDRALQVYGTDYATRNGSCVRDYIHVQDLASAHLMGLQYLFKDEASGVKVFNLGTAQGSSVLDVIQVAEKVIGKKATFNVYARRAGDAAILIADSTKIKKEWGWQAQHSSIEDIIRTVLAWELKSKHHQ